MTSDRRPSRDDLVPNTLAGRPQHGRIDVSYASAGGATFPLNVHESGPLRLRHPRASACEAVLINTGGGIVGGDRFAIDVALGAAAAVTMTSVAAEKVYRTDGDASAVTTRLSLATGSRLLWMPQETILFDRSRLRRRFEVDLAADASLVSAEMVVFGRTASGERDVSGSFREGWRVRREGNLMFADETAIEGSIGAHLDRPAVARGARALGTILIVRPDAAGVLDDVRGALAHGCRDGSVEGAASLREGIIIARLLAHSSERLRAIVVGVLGAIEGIRMPRLWV